MARTPLYQPNASGQGHDDIADGAALLDELVRLDDAVERDPLGDAVLQCYRGNEEALRQEVGAAWRGGEARGADRGGAADALAR